MTYQDFMQESKNRFSCAGDVYILINLKTWKTKIGLSGNVDRRLREIRSDYGLQVTPVFVCATSNMWRLEQTAHKHFEAYKMPEPQGKTGYSEWFKLSPCLLIKMIIYLYTINKQYQIGDRIYRSWWYRLLNMLKR